MKHFLILFAGMFSSLGAFEFDLKAIEDHLDRKFAQAHVETYPCPHIVIENVLPDALYDELEAHWPGELFNGPTLLIGKLPTTDEYTQNLWSQFSQLVSNKILKKKIAQLFSPYVTYKFGRHIDGPFLCNSKNVFEHRLVQCFSIRPHIDQGYIYAPIFIYMPLTNDDYEWGTILYKNLRERKSLDVEYEGAENVEVVKVAPYKRNTLFSFMRTPESWHGGAQPANVTRKYYVTNIYLSERFMNSFYDTTFDMMGNNVMLDEIDLY